MRFLEKIGDKVVYKWLPINWKKSFFWIIGSAIAGIIIGMITPLIDIFVGISGMEIEWTLRNFLLSIYINTFQLVFFGFYFIVTTNILFHLAVSLRKKFSIPEK
jgi:type III secretory pathway component EscV